MLVDSHCHLDRIDLTPYNHQLEQALAAAKANDVGYFLTVSVDLESFPLLLKIVRSFDNISASVGVHPNEKDVLDPSVADLVLHAANPNVCAIGETGLDYFRSQGDLTWQHARFRRHIQAAKESNKPLIIHTRQAREDTLRIMREEHAEIVGGVMHCFTETWAMAQEAMELGFYISFSGIVTFKNAKELQEVAKKVPLERMLLETDCPYLAPEPYRGKPNEPAYVRYVAERIAQLRAQPYELIAEKTTENFCRLFNVNFNTSPDP